MNIPSFNNITIKDYTPEKSVLKNNIPIYTFANNDLEVVFMRIVFFNAGTIFQDKFFVSALTKTQLAQDTKDYSDLSLADAMDYYGVSLTRANTNERTYLTFSFLKKYQKEVVSLIEQILLLPVFKQEKLNITIGDYRQEFLAKCQKTSFLAHREFMAGLFGKDNPYGNYASVEDYDKVTISDIEKFYKQRYTFNQCYIILAGNVDKELIRLLNDSLGAYDWNSSSADTTPNNIKINTQIEPKTIITHLDNAVQASICMGRFFPSIKDEDYIPLTVLNCLFGGYFNSRLMSNIREEKGYTYGIDSFIAPFEKGSVFMIAGDVTNDKDTATIDEIKKEMNLLKTEIVSDAELDTVKNYMIGDMLRDNDGVSEIAITYDRQIKFSLADNYNSYAMNIIKNITPDKIKELANKYFDEQQFIISISKNNK